MSIYTVPALNAVDFALTPHTVPSLASPPNVLSAYTVPSLAAVSFALVAYTAPTYMDIGWELLSSFPTQYSGLRCYYNGAVRELCLVAAADANTGMGAAPMIRKGGTTYAVYLVETTDPNATPVRLRTSAGTKAIRVKT
jgi:hypothetical protein